MVDVRNAGCVWPGVALQLADEGGPMKEDDLDDFWSKLGFVLMTIDSMEDQNAAAALGAFLEGYMDDSWPDIVASMRKSADWRALFERSLLVLAKKDSP
jgi:hypothetical protein